MRIGRGSYWTCILLCACVAFPGLAETPDAAETPDVAFDHLDWEGIPPQDHHVVEIFNPFGDIRLRPSESAGMVASAVVQILAPGQPKAKLDIARMPERTRIRIVLENGPKNLDEYTGRVDLVVLLPTHVDIDARTTYGNIRLKSLRGRISLRSATGRIDAIFKKLSRRSGNGTKSAFVLETETGDIDAGFLVDTDLRLHVQTAGTIQTQIPNDLVDNVRQSRGMLTGNLGTAENPVTIRSAFGTIHLRIPNARVQKNGDGGKK